MIYITPPKNRIWTLIMATQIFTETDDEMIRSFRYWPETSVEFKTAKQDVKILDTVLFGKTLFIDGVLQSSVKDEEIYHRKLVHPALGHKPHAKTVCILGGGEGATAREVLKYKNVESVTMIDWDKELVEYFRDKETAWHKGALLDPRVTLEHSDIFEVLNEPRKYDVIIIDLTDPEFEDGCWGELFVTITRWLNPEGVLVANTGGMFPWDLTTTTKAEELLKAGLGTTPHTLYKYKQFVPSFGREWTFVHCRLI
jgi:spermidine synthase